MIKKKYAVFTMDVEAFTDTECINALNRDVDADLMDGFDEYMRLLDKHGIKSTLFTVGELAPSIAGKLKKYIENGHRLALHSFKHIAPMNVDLNQFREQTARAKEQLSRLFKTDVVGFRAPCFSIDRERLDILQELGFTYDSSNLNFVRARHTVKVDLSGFKKLREGIFSRNGFYEFGLSNQEIFGQNYPISGGGYVRLGNWEFIKSLIKKYISSSDYYVFYLHPFELSKRKIPVFKELKLYDKFYLKYGIGSYDKKIEQIIFLLKKYGYEFVTFEELTKIMNSEKI